MNVIETFKNPYKILAWLSTKGFFKNMDDEKYIKMQYRGFIGKQLDLNNVKTFNEKIQWLKINDRNPLYTNMVDKYLVKQYVSDLIGDEYIIPTIGVYDSFEDINFSTLPNQFVIKTTHDSGGVVVCKNKEIFDIDKARKFINSSIKRNYYKLWREWPYKNVKPRIIVEKYIEDEQTKELRDYKLFCFNGKMKLMFIACDRQNNKSETTFDFFDENFRHIDVINGHPTSKKIIECPPKFQEMKRLAEKLSKNIPLLRVDLYQSNGKIYFGELTFFHWSGYVPFKPEKYDEIFGNWIEI